MSILMGLLALMGTLGVILWRLNAAADAAKGLVETADDARGLFRRWKWRSKLAENPLDLIQDPREAAAASAAHAVLVAMVPAQKAALDAALAQSLAKVGDERSRADGVAVGKAAADQMLAWREGQLRREGGRQAG